MASDESVTDWLGQFQNNDHEAARKLWDRYFQRLVQLARANLQSAPRRVADEEDVALGAFDSFFRGLERGRFPQLQDRHDLWRILVTLTLRKAQHLVRDETRQKRGGGAREEAAALQDLASQEPTPQMAALVADECRLLLERLGDAGLRTIAMSKMEGYTNVEIAARLGCALATVERRLALIRQIWDHEDAA